VNVSLLLCGLLLGQPAVEPPIAGRPTDWSGAIGGPYVVTMTAEPAQQEIADRETLTLQITVADGGSAGNLRDVKRPGLSKMEAYKAFAIEDLAESYSENPPRREFRYALRPRFAGVHEVPRLKFIYYSPRAGRYQTTYSNSPTTMVVTPGVAPSSPAVPREVPDWMLEYATDNEIFGFPRTELEYELHAILFSWFGVPFARPEEGGGLTIMHTAAVCLPLLVCAVWFAAWRRGHPDAARMARISRSRAASVALRSLREPAPDPAAQIFTALADYLRARLGVSAVATSPTETAQALRRVSNSLPLVGSTVALLERCVAARFAPVPEFDPLAISDAERVILEWEEQTCSPVGA